MSHEDAPMLRRFVNDHSSFFFFLLPPGVYSLYNLAPIVKLSSGNRLEKRKE